MTQIPNGHVDTLATLEDALPQAGLRLLGTMGTPQAPEAILLLRQDVLRVAPGDMAGNAKVIAIEPGRVIFSLGGETRALTMPRLAAASGG
ncbi:MAG: hypothetical protein AAFZ02_03810 [Pseudomonadota bacterium]